MCIIELQPGERITGEPQIGDSIRWNISPAEYGQGEQSTSVIVLKPQEPGLDTNLLITTDRRAYYLRLVSKPQEYVARVAFSYRLAARRTPPLVQSAPFFTMLPVDNVREGFLSWDSYRLLRDALPDRVKLLFVLAFHVGCRRGELLKLEWQQVDFGRKELRLKRSTTKNRTPRSLPFYGDMEKFLRKAWEDRSDEATTILVEDDGTALGAFRKSWATACKAAGVGELLFHDLRRTAVRNMMDAGIPQSHAMYISGHKTDSIFRRYDIVSDDRPRRRFREDAEPVR